MQYLYMIFYVNDQMVRPLHATFCLSVFIEKLKIICMIFWMKIGKVILHMLLR